MKIVFFGSPSAALPSLKKIAEAGHDIPLIITQPDRPSGRGKKITFSPVKVQALKMDIPVCQPVRMRKDPDFAGRLKEIQPDLNVVVAYGQIIPAEITNLPRYNSINLHFSLLPKYRGASPVQWALLNGEAKTGITIFELNERMDEGDILAQEEVDIFPGEDSAMLESRLAQYGADLLIRTASHIALLPRRKQDHSQATYAPKIQKEDGRIDWEKDAVHLERMIRAFTPWPSVYSSFDNKRVKIIRGKKTSKLDPRCSPGQIVNVHKQGIEIACGQGSIFLAEILQPENKRAMDAYAFSLGAQLQLGMKFIS